MSNPNIQDSQPKKFNWAIAGVAGAVIIGGGAYAAWQFLGGKELTPLQAAELIPQDALMTGYISTDSQAWSKLDKFGTPEARQIITQGMDNFKKDVLAPENINYEQDLQPWMGNVMFAMLPEEKTGSSNENMLVIFGIKNKLKALDFANKLKSQSKGESKESDYKGETLVETKSEKGGKTYYAVMGDRLVLTSERKNLERSIDTLKGSPSIADKSETKELLSQGVDVANPVAKFWIIDYGKFFKQIMASNPNATEIPAEMLAQIDKVKAMEIGVGIVDTGFHFQSITKIDPTLVPATYKTTQSKIVSHLPANTIFAFNGQGISQNWGEIVKQFESNAQFKEGLEQTRTGFKNSLKLDLDTDFIGWMNGEFAIALVETQQGTAASYGMGGSMIFETSDRAKAENTFKKIDELIESQSGGFITKQEKDVDGTKVTEWSISTQNAALFSHGWINNNSLAISMGTPFSDAVASSKNSLKDSANFKAITGSLPNNNYGYFYVDMDKVMGIANKLGLTASMPQNANAFISSISGLGGTATLPDKSTSKTDFLLTLKPTK
jgi:Protein of unknown function (DUF3352)